MQRIFYFLFILCTAYTTGAQIPQLVSDINAGAASSNPNYLTPFGSRLYFCATDAAHGHELYQYNGSTPALVADINAGTADGTANVTAYTDFAMGRLGSKIYFAGGNAATGLELYSYDTTTGASTLAADINPGAAASNPGGFFKFGSKLYFTASTTANGYELYSYDGVNPPLLYDIRPGPGNGVPNHLTGFNGRLYFSAADSVYGQELFVLDTTSGAFSMAQDINPGSLSSYPYSFQVIGNKMYFDANTAANGFELYSFDGTIATRLTDVSPGTASGVVAASHPLPVFNGDIYFCGSTNGNTTQLWKYTIATSTAVMVYDVFPGGNADITDYKVFNGVLYFSSHSPLGNELWKYDGSNCTIVADLAPGNANSNPTAFTVWNNAFYFTANNGTAGTELYRLTAGTGIQNVTFDGFAAIYPNPARDKFTVDVSTPVAEDLSVSLTDAAGKEIFASGIVHCSSGINRIVIPVGSFPAGQYFYQATDEKGFRLFAGSIPVQH